MSAALIRTAAAAVAIAALAGLAALSVVPYGADTTGEAVVRLAWRARVEPVEDCRHLTPGELERLPVHMRRTEVCEGRVPPYGLQVTLDGDTVIAEVARAAGARRDRPLYVFHELRAIPGTHRLVVRFARDVADSVVARHEAGEGEELERAEGERWFPIALSLDTTVTLAPRQAVLVTYDEERGALVVKPS